MADNKSFLDFELPPLPKLPPKDGESDAAQTESPKEPVKREKPPLDGDFKPTKREKPPLDGAPAEKKLADDGLPPLKPIPPKPAAPKTDEPVYSKTPLDDDYVPVEEVAHVKRVTAMGETDLAQKQAEKEPEPEKPYEENGMIFTDDYDPDDSALPSLGEMDGHKKKLKLAPMSSAKQSAEKNMKEQIKMSDLLMEVGTAPVLEDLSDEYGDTKERKKNLAEQDRLDNNEKKQLVRSMKEDISYIPQSYNARASKKMYNKLMEEKNLKIAKKGMLISFIPVSLGIIACVCELIMKFNWGSHQYIDYASYLGIAGAVFLLIKSKQFKTFGMICYAITMLVFLIPGLILYTIAFMQDYYDATNSMQIVAGVICVFCFVISLIILGKSESVAMYYNTKFKRKRD